VARVVLAPPRGTQRTRDPAKVLESALRQVQQTVRADDRVCPFGVSRIGIAFGPDAEAVTTRILGERLARAVAFGLASEESEGHRPPGARNKKRHDNSSNGKGDRRADDPDRATAVVTVDRLVRDSSHREVKAGASDDAGSDSVRVPTSAPFLRHRTVVQYPSARKPWFGVRHDDRTGPSPGEPAGTILVVDPTPSMPGSPGLAAQAAAATSEKLGFHAEAIAPTNDEILTLASQIGDLDLVILVVGSEPAGESRPWSQSTWCVPARLAAGYASLGGELLAVSAGAGAGALIGCYEKGATILFDLDQLPSELHRRRRNRRGQRPISDVSPRVPSRFEALLHLTASERRILFYLTTGKSAQEIADNLVVSLTTVRSHIRSILRKLGVRSQLAAVVCANSRDLGRIQPQSPPAESTPAAGLQRRRNA
jgi:DNA-binding CsgD family transcriptional regulator